MSTIISTTYSMLLRFLSVIAVLLLTGSVINAQFINISDGGTAYLCSGALLDSGGEGASGYSNNEDYTLTICSDGTGGETGISLQWITFNLSTDGAAPTDNISIYDGDNISAPLIGSWYGQNNPGIISASFTNTSGCLTVVFHSNEAGVGVFASAVSCVTPCEPPTAVANMGQIVPALICQGEVLTFDGSASTAPGSNTLVEYRWNFDDGIQDSLSGPVVTHSFSEAGEYVVQLTLTDNNDCNNTNLVDLQILVSTTPNFAGTSQSTTICQGESVDLLGNPNPVTWSDLPESSLGEGIFLPDDLGVPFNTSITFTNFSPGQTLNSVNDLLSVCVDMEHSWMGDLVIQLACPSGESVIFHQQGGGGTFLGEPIDEDLTPDLQGVCYTYCWSPTATNGTWADNAGGTLAAGTYESLNPMSALVGCDLNGTWTFTVTDLWGSDNGYICDWGLTFNSSLFPDLTTFTPILGTTPDSVGWTGPGLVVDPTDPRLAVATPTQQGVFDYILSVTDNFGCTYDTTITITVTPGIMGPVVLTGDPLICDGGMATITAPTGYDTYSWSNGDMGISTTDGPGTYICTVSLGTCTLPSEPFTVVGSPSPDPVISGPSFSCGGGQALLSTTEPYATYLWSNNGVTPTVSVNSGSYTVTVTNADGCSATSTPFSVLIGNNPTAAYSTNPISPQEPNTTVDFTNLSTGNGSTISGYQWTFVYNGNSTNTVSPSYTYVTPGTYPITLIVTTTEGCADTLYGSYVIRPLDITVPNVFTPNNDNFNDALVFENLQFYTNNLTIFNRWGNKVYEKENYQNTWRGTDLPDGTYFFILTVPEGRQNEYTGHITLLR